MTDALTSSTGVLAAWYSYFWLGGEEWDLTTTGPCEAGMITPTAASDGVLIDTATAAGYFRVTLQSRDDEPPAPTEEWEDVVRGSLLLSTAAIYALPTAADGDYIELPLPRAGLYGFQVSGKGRVPSDSMDKIDPEEQYLIDVWPISQQIAPTIVKATSARIAERLAFP